MKVNYSYCHCDVCARVCVLNLYGMFGIGAETCIQTVCALENIIRRCYFYNFKLRLVHGDAQVILSTWEYRQGNIYMYK